MSKPSIQNDEQMFIFDISDQWKMCSNENNITQKAYSIQSIPFIAFCDITEKSKNERTEKMSHKRLILCVKSFIVLNDD